MNYIWNKIAWGGDPDEINDVTGLSKRDIYNIRKSWTAMYAESEKYGLQLFLGLFRLNPVTKTFFKTIQDLDEEAISNSAQFRAHVINFMTSFNSAVTNLEHPEIVIALMNKLGESHRRRRIQKEHFDEVKVVLVDILKNQLNASDDLLASWTRFVGFIYKNIFEKLCETADC
ncbi:hypothetical protein ABMA28_014818 [Loxostege sticticalis]|uniref:Globin domain-containing protein n=1 Tax=Loxostege sticticalis TaxID=481309 RepID=A0ABD0TCC8_LOXSC